MSSAALTDAKTLVEYIENVVHLAQQFERDQLRTQEVAYVNDLSTYNGVEFCDLSSFDKEQANQGILWPDTENFYRIPETLE